MAFTGKLFGLFWKSALNKELDIDSDQIKAALFTNALVINQDTHQYFDAAPYTANQCAGTNYTAGGLVVSPGSMAYDAATNKLSIDLTDNAWANLTLNSPGARYMVVYDNTPAANKPLIGYVDFQADQEFTNGTMSIAWDAAGAFYVTVASAASPPKTTPKGSLMPQGKATRKTKPVDYFWLNTAADIVPAMNALNTINWNAQLVMARNAAGVLTWTFTAAPNDPASGAKPITATLGDVLVWDTVQLVKMRAENFQTDYTVP